MLSSPRNPVGSFVGNFQKHKPARERAKEREYREGKTLAKFWKLESGGTVVTNVT